MALFGFNNYKPRQFKYNPVTYDPDRKTHDDKRELTTESRLPDSEKEYEPGKIIRQRYGERVQDMHEMRRNRRSKNIRSIVIVIALVVAAIWILLTI